MAIQKKSLINKLNTTKQAIVTSSTPTKENPSVGTPVAARVHVGGRKWTKISARVGKNASARIRPSC